MTRYQCSGPDKEDLTNAVRAKVDARPTTIFRLSASKLSRRRKRGRSAQMTVVVYCRQGHKNVFEVKGESD